MTTIKRTYVQTLDGAVPELRSMLRIAADRIDDLRPDTRPADVEALQWLLAHIEGLARDVADCGGPIELPGAAWALATAAEAVDGRQAVLAVHAAFDRVEALAGLAAASLLRERGRCDGIRAAWQCLEAQPI